MRERTSTALSDPLIDMSMSDFGSVRDTRATTARQRRRYRSLLRRAIAQVASELQLSKIGTPRRLDLAAAEEHVRFFLPKDSTGKLLNLRCSEDEFSARVGTGVALYMRFVRTTGYMFAVATLVALPQIIANVCGTRLQLRWPWEASCDATLPPDGEPVARLAALGGQAALHALLSTLLGNASLGEGLWTDGAHLFSASTLCGMFCVYVYWVWSTGLRGLSAAPEASSARASDFAVRVSCLPRAYTDPHAVKAHFSFFGPIASIALSVDSLPLLRSLERQHRLAAAWRKLHTMHALLPAAQKARRAPALRRAAERLLVKMTRARATLRAESAAPCVCNGTAFVVFRRRTDAARCVRHFELIRAHERSHHLSVGTNVDFRQLYFRTAHKLQVSRACEPSDIIWRNLRYSRATMRAAGVRTTLLVALFSCLSTAAITVANFMGTSHSSGAITTVWVTMVIIASNVVIFNLVPYFAVRRERHHYRSYQHMHMLLKMTFFQIFNTSVSVLAFLFLTWDVDSNTACPLSSPSSGRTRPAFACTHMRLGGPGLLEIDVDALCVSHWYSTGALVLMNGLFGDLAVILGIIEFVRPEKLFARRVRALHAATQTEMNEGYELDADLYLPFRYQLTLKVVFLTAMFCPAIPLLLPFASAFMFASHRVDRYNLLRVLKPPPRTTDRTITLSVLYVLPLAVVAHMWMAIFFYSKQARLDVPLLYFALLGVLSAFFMARLSAEISRRQAPQVAPPYPLGEGADSRDDADATAWTEASSENGRDGKTTSPAGGQSDAEGLDAHLDRIELYVPPLTATLLEWTHRDLQVKHRDISARRGRG